MRIIAIEGIDKAGKETQVKLLKERLTKEGYKVATMSFPRYHTPVGAMIYDALHNETTLSLMEVAKLYEIDRYFAQEDFERLEKEGVDVLILDRYVMSNMAFKRAQGVSEVDLLFLQHGLWLPDVQIIIDIPVEESVRRSQNYALIDKYEKDTELLERVRQVYLEYAAKGTYYGQGKVYTVDGCRAPEEVSDHIYHIAKIYI
jgi:dTMP kinase